MQGLLTPEVLVNNSPTILEQIQEAHRATTGFNSAIPKVETGSFEHPTISTLLHKILETLTGIELILRSKQGTPLYDANRNNIDQRIT